MEELDEKSNERNSHETSRLQSHKTPQKRSFVESIREGLKKIGGCQDVEEIEITKPKRNNKQHHDLFCEEKCHKIIKKSRTNNSIKKKKDATADLQQCGFDEFHNKVPKIDSMKRTLSWVYHSELNSDSKISLSVLPMRGTLLPTRYTTEHKHYSYYCDDGIMMSVSSCESARGTHGRGTPPILDPKTPRLDDLFQQLQQKQEREARRQIIAAGERHLLSFNLLDVYSHQVSGMPIGTTPEILPFMAPTSFIPRTSKKSQPRSCHIRTIPSTLELPQHVCKWLSCSRRFHSAEELFSHVDQCHIQAYKTITTRISTNRNCMITCKWNNCNHICHARYKLLLHVHNHHYKEMPHSMVSTIFSVLLIVYEISLGLSC